MNFGTKHAGFRLAILFVVIVMAITFLSRSESSYAAASVYGSGSAVYLVNSKVDKEQYQVEMRAGACSTGQECQAEIIINAKQNFHIDDKYPIKFKVAEPVAEGVTYTKTQVKREDGRFSEKEGKLPISFKAAKPGKVKISGTFSFSVVTDANAIIDKVDLAIEVDVK